jgi:hypothetical protein
MTETSPPSQQPPEDFWDRLGGRLLKVGFALRLYVLAYPILLPLSVYITYLAGRITLGHWPLPSIDDPASIGHLVDITYLVAIILLMYGYMAFQIAILLILYLACLVTAEWKRSLATSAVGIVLMGASVFFMRWDPHQVGTWFMD